MEIEHIDADALEAVQAELGIAVEPQPATLRIIQARVLKRSVIRFMVGFIGAAVRPRCASSRRARSGSRCIGLGFFWFVGSRARVYVCLIPQRMGPEPVHLLRTW